MSRCFCTALAALLMVVGAARAEGSEPGLELRVLDCGAMSGMETEAFLPDSEDLPERFDMVNRCFLVVHPKGTLLWDVGFARGFQMRAMAWFLWITSLGESEVETGPSLVEQLAERGMTPADIDYLAVSHSHFDHIGQSEDFAGSTWLVQKVERDWAFSPDLDNDAVFPGTYEALRDAETLELSGDHDVFGDGSVEILSSPGHTPGHQCLFLDLPETGPVVLSGDLYHSLLNRERREPPAFNTDREQTRRSMEHIENVVRERGAVLWIQHSPESGPSAPASVR